MCIRWSTKPWNWPTSNWCRHNVRLTHYVAARLPQVMADTILIEQVLVNLMKNGAEAIQHADRPAPTAAWSCAWCPADR